MPKLIDSEKVIERINERINALPQSRIELGGFHTGQLAAYQNIIDDLRASTFDPTPVQPDIKPGDKVRHKDKPYYGIGLVYEVSKSGVTAHCGFPEYDGLMRGSYPLEKLEVIKDE